MDMSHAAPSALTLPGDPGTDSAETLYIREQVEPRRDERNTWAEKEIYGATKLLWRSTRPHKVSPKKMNDSNFLFYHSGRLIGGSDRSVTTLASHQARKACASRFMLRNYLQASGLPVPTGKTFHVSQVNSAVEFLHQLGGSVTVGPVSSTRQQGHSTGIEDERHFVHAWKFAADSIESLPPAQRQVLVGRHYEGLDLRVYVIGEEVAAALVRVPFYVVGDGDTPLLELVSRLLEAGSADRYLKLPDSDQIAGFLERTGADPSTTPHANEISPISVTSNSAAGEAITVDVTGTIHPQLKQLAVDAMWAFPGLSATGVDLRVAAIDNPTGAVITEVDPAADITEFRYPTYGQYRRVSMDIIRQMVRSAQR